MKDREDMKEPLSFIFKVEAPEATEQSHFNTLILLLSSFRNNSFWNALDYEEAKQNKNIMINEMIKILELLKVSE